LDIPNPTGVSSRKRKLSQEATTVDVSLPPEKDPRKLQELRREIAIGIAEAEQEKVAPLNAKETLARVRKARESQVGKVP
jgi:hypothetical protein